MIQILVISLLFLSSCTINKGKNYHWYKPNCSEDEYKIVRYKCLKESLNIPNNPYAEAFKQLSQRPAVNASQRGSNAFFAGFGAGIQASQNLVNSEYLLFENCMEAYGFSWSPVNN